MIIKLLHMLQSNDFQSYYVGEKSHKWGVASLHSIQKIFHTTTKIYLGPVLLSDQTLKSILWLQFLLNLLNVDLTRKFNIVLKVAGIS